MARLTSRTAIVTGGASGIGRATAMRLAAEGARVVIADIDDAGGQAVAEAIRVSGGTAAFIATDVRNEAAVAELVRGTVELYGTLNLAFNNAGIGPGRRAAPIHRTPGSLWHDTLAANLTSIFYCLKYEIEFMVEHGGGAIVNMSSTAGLKGDPGSCAYSTSKHGVTGLTKVAALEYVKQGIRVNSIHPAGVDTPMLSSAMQDPVIRRIVEEQMPGGRLATAEEVASAVVWLLSDDASFVTGAQIPVDGGTLAG